MYNDRPSTKHMILTLVGWAVGLLAVAGIMVAISTAMAPKTPSDKAPAQTEATSTATASVLPTLVVPPPVTTTAPVPVPVPVPAPVPTPTPSQSSSPAKSLTGKVVAIDAGHQAGGDSSLEPVGPGSSQKKPKVTSGTSGVTTHNAESSINLQVALKLRAELLRRGAKVVMIRTKQGVNISNSKRASIANRAKADLFIRLHCNGSTDHSVTGLSTLVPKSNTWTKPIVAESRKAGGYVHKSVVGQTGARDRGVVGRSDLSGFNWAKVPTVLVEMGFLSNSAEDVKLSTAAYQQSLASGMASGIEKYLKAP